MQIDKPSKVRKGMILLYITLGIGFLRGFMEAPQLSQQIPTGRIFFIMFFVFIMMWFFIYMIGKGKNWARITFLVLFILGIPISVLPMYHSLITKPFSGILGIAQAIMQIVALVLLFQKSSSDWYKQMNIRRKNAEQGDGANR